MGIRICYTPVFIDKINVEWENILYPIVATDLHRLISSVSHSKVCISVTGAFWTKMAQTYLTARLWTFSKSSLKNFWWGDQIQEEYSSVGLTSVWYASVFVDLEEVLMLWQTKPSILSPFVATLATWLCQVRLPAIWTPIGTRPPGHSPGAPLSGSTLQQWASFSLWYWLSCFLWG